MINNTRITCVVFFLSLHFSCTSQQKNVETPWQHRIIKFAYDEFLNDFELEKSHIALCEKGFPIVYNDESRLRLKMFLSSNIDSSLFYDLFLHSGENGFVFSSVSEVKDLVVDCSSTDEETIFAEKRYILKLSSPLFIDFEKDNYLVIRMSYFAKGLNFTSCIYMFKINAKGEISLVKKDFCYWG